MLANITDKSIYIKIVAAALYKTLFISILTIERKKFKIIVLALVPTK